MTLKAVVLSNVLIRDGRAVFCEARLQVIDSGLGGPQPFKSEMTIYIEPGLKMPAGSEVSLELMVTKLPPEKPHPAQAELARKRYYEAQELVRSIRRYDSELAPLFKRLHVLTDGLKKDDSGTPIVKGLPGETQSEVSALTSQVDNLGRARDKLKLILNEMRKSLPEHLAKDPSVKLDG